MADACVLAVTHDHLELTIGFSTSACRSAQEIHELAPTSAVAMGRMLTCAGLMAVTSKREGKTSLQLISKARIGQMFVDATHQGDLRGMVRNPSLAFPGAQSPRLTVAPAVHPGQLSVVRKDSAGNYIQSATPLVSGEVDRDIEFFIEQSDQVLTALAADVLLGRDGVISHAAGILVQALPDGDPEHLTALRQRVVGGAWIEALQAADSPESLLRALEPEARIIGTSALAWRCPCSRERAKNAIRLLGPNELGSAVVANEPLSVDCDFCNTKYVFEVDELSALMAETTVAKG